MAGRRACEHGMARKGGIGPCQCRELGTVAQGGTTRRAVGPHRAGPARALAGPGGPFGHLYSQKETTSFFVRQHNYKLCTVISMQY
jgi:hypothetical protein